MSDQIKTNSGFVAVIEFQILPAWFELDTRTQRDYAAQLGAMMERWEAVDSRWFDADAWTSKLSDFVIFEFADLIAYNELWSEMRRHPFLATPYARIRHILMGMELEIKGLARLADSSSANDQLSKPPSTQKPSKPSPLRKPERPPETSKPKKDAKDNSSSGTKVCHFCGHTLKFLAKFCSRCGTAAKAPSVTDISE